MNVYLCVEMFSKFLRTQFCGFTNSYRCCQKTTTSTIIRCKSGMQDCLKRSTGGPPATDNVFCFNNFGREDKSRLHLEGVSNEENKQNTCSFYIINRCRSKILLIRTFINFYSKLLKYKRFWQLWLWSYKPIFYQEARVIVTWMVSTH